MPEYEFGKIVKPIILKNKIVTVVGARPQFIKAAALSRELLKHDNIEEIIIHTGQHFNDNMSKIFFDEMSIPTPKYNLDINGVSHGVMTGRMLEAIENILQAEKPNLVIVYGDTNSTLAGVLAAKKLHIKVAHVEAGLRSYNMDMPEEINRILTDRISDYLFCPTQNAVQNLIEEGFNNFACKIFNVGDVMQDAALFYSQESSIKSTILRTLSFKNFILCTLHRAENTDSTERLLSIITSLNKINETTPIILPLHPRTKKMIENLDVDTKLNIIEPVGYHDMIELLKYCSLVITDSGGLQKEAYFFKKKCITLRNETEWVELVEYGVNILSDVKEENLVSNVEKMLAKEANFEVNLYGNGNASSLICSELLKLFN